MGKAAKRERRKRRALCPVCEPSALVPTVVYQIFWNSAERTATISDKVTGCPVLAGTPWHFSQNDVSSTGHPVVPQSELWGITSQIWIALRLELLCCISPSVSYFTLFLCFGIPKFRLANCCNTKSKILETTQAPSQANNIQVTYEAGCFFQTFIESDSHDNQQWCTQH